MDKRQDSKIARIRMIKNALREAKKQGKTISKEKFIAELGVKIGIARRTSLEYFQALIDSGQAHYKIVETGEVAFVLGGDKSHKGGIYTQQPL